MAAPGAQTQLEHKLWQSLTTHQLADKKILVALSGGVDSMALLESLAQVLPVTQIFAAYFHHGFLAKESEQSMYRDKAAQFCEEHCAQKGIKSYILRMDSSLPPDFLDHQKNSEQYYREHRYRHLEDLRQKLDCAVIALGHHQEDLLETRLIRLIRGTGLQGLQAMQTLDQMRYRPFLKVSKKSLGQYLEDRGLVALEDPSNQNLDPLRNWIRQDWLPQLEGRQEGATKSFANSLEALVQEYKALNSISLLDQARSAEGISRSFYLTLSPEQQRTLLAQFLYLQQIKSFSQAHLEEIQKRLDNSQKVLSFKTAGCHFEVNAEQIKVQS